MARIASKIRCRKSWQFPKNPWKFPKNHGNLLPAAFFMPFRCLWPLALATKRVAEARCHVATATKRPVARPKWPVARGKWPGFLRSLPSPPWQRLLDIVADIYMVGPPTKTHLSDGFNEIFLVGLFLDHRLNVSQHRLPRPTPSRIIQCKLAASQSVS